MSIAGVFATCRRSVTSCKAGALGAAVVPLPALGSGREVGLGDQQHGAVGMGEKWGFTGTQWGVCGRRGYRGWEDVAPGPMEVLVCSSYSGSLATLITNIRVFGDV